ncbi:VOC family protein [Paenibacillus alginolyticus]|uniref:VOC family protein n=1 Tax=Paenibacillus alginolyticus TaxID=59839 RepID=UPI0028B22177|nr:VOC family protein [Paenibacillus frigoriresistens]
MKFHKQPNTFVNHVQLIVEQLERSLSFYQGILGFQILDRTDSTASPNAKRKRCTGDPRAASRCLAERTTTFRTISLRDTSTGPERVGKSHTTLH